jgi:Domain of unknown function (DUF4129)
MTLTTQSLGSTAVVFTLVFLCAARARAATLDDYHRRVKQAATALATLTEPEENENQIDYDARVAATLKAVREVLPTQEDVSWENQVLQVDNSWLDEGLKRYENEKGSNDARLAALAQTIERLRALELRLGANPSATGGDGKADAKARLLALLQRPEYRTTEPQESALERLWHRFLRWLDSVMPRSQPLKPGATTTLSRFAEIFVVLLALAVIGYVLKLIAPYLARAKRSRLPTRTSARIILGEMLEPDRSATDLLAEAEALARTGNLRAAIRKAYIALLVELSDRRLIQLAQHLTNRDYLLAVREQPPLFATMVRLTDTFERHWYGLVDANDNDWLAFREGYQQALRR